MKSITELLAGSAFGRKLAVEAEKEDLNERRRLVERRRRAEKDLVAAKKQHAPVIEARFQAAKEARLAAADAERAYHEAFNDKVRAFADIDHAISNIDRALRNSADKRIRESAIAMNRRFDDARETLGVSKTVKRNVLGGGVYDEVGNERARQQLVAAIREARAAFDQLELQAVDDVEGSIVEILAPVDHAWSLINQLDDEFTPAPAA